MLISQVNRAALFALVSIALAIFVSPISIAQEKLADEEVRRGEVETFMQDMRERFIAGDAEKIAAIFDIERMVLTAEENGILTFESEAAKKSILRGVKPQAMMMAGVWSQVLSWDKLEVRNIEFPDKNKDNAVVFARHWDDEYEVYSKMRWWLHRDEGGDWKMFDMADLDMYVRTSTMFGLGFHGAMNDEPWVTSLMEISREIQQLGSVEAVLEGVEPDSKKFDSLVEEDVPVEVRGFGLMLVALKFMASDEHVEEALDAVREMREVSPDAHVSFYLEGQALTGLEKYKEAICRVYEVCRHLRVGSRYLRGCSRCMAKPGQQTESGRVRHQRTRRQ